MRHGVQDLLPDLGILFRERRHERIKQSKNVIADEDLAIAMRACADADGWNFQAGSYRLRDGLGNRLEHQCKGACVLQRKRIRDQFLRCLVISGLLPHSSQMMHILRRQPEMSHNRETGLSKPPNGLRNGASALQLHGSSAPFLEEPCRVLHGLLGRNLVGQKGHVCHHQRAIGPSRNRTRMMDHRLEGYRNCRIQSQNDIPERISDEQKIDPGSIEQPGHSGIVGRQHDDSLAPLLHQDEVRHSDLSGRGVHHEDLFTKLESQTSRLVITLRRLTTPRTSCWPLHFALAMARPSPLVNWKWVGSNRVAGSLIGAFGVIRLRASRRPSVSDTVKASFSSRSPFVFERQLHPGAICRHFAVLDFQIGLYYFGNAQIAQCSSSRLDCISCGILPGFRTRADYLRYFIYGVCSLCLFWHAVSFLLFTLVHSATESRAGLPFESRAGLARRQCFRRDRGPHEKLTVSLLKPAQFVGDNTARRVRENECESYLLS